MTIKIIITITITTMAIPDTDYSYLETEAIYVPETVIRNITEWNVEVKKYTFNAKNGWNMEIYYAFPKTVDENTKILFIMNGADTGGKIFTESFRYLSETENIIAIEPTFEQVPGTSQYNELNIARNINNPENWNSKIIDDLFLDFKKRFSLPHDKYILYGFSKGSQFVHRATMFSESPYMEYSISAAPGGWMTFPTDQANYPYGIKNLPMYKNLMNSNFSRKMYLLSGNRDTATGDRPEANFQGSNRHERELNFYQTSKNYCKQNSLSFNIDLLIMDGVGHSDIRTRPYVIDIIKGIYDDRKANNNNGDGTPIVEPLIQTKWDQGEPYNNMFPMEGDAHTLTVCDVTAMAQIMKYYKHPVQAVNFDVAYDWNNMLNAYTKANPGTERE
jgi:hypothetical protein